MDDASYPALFRSADQAANRKQNAHLWLIRGEYSLLLLAAVFSINIFEGTTFYLIFAFVFVLSLAVLLTRALWRPVQDWYRCRALAESVKTLTWRYMMRAAPFVDAERLQVPRGEFRNHLHQLFEANRITAEKIVSDWSGEDQITGEMDRVRRLGLDERKKFYSDHRLKDQRGWYVRKAQWNNKAAAKWVGVGVAAYVMAVILAFSRIQFPEWQPWPIEPLIVLASSVVGWMQTKKFGELAAAYTVTAHEIGLIAPKLDAVKTEAEFSDVVNEAELAFSREHTMWIARQTN